MQPARMARVRGCELSERPLNLFLSQRFRDTNSAAELTFLTGPIGGKFADCGATAANPAAFRMLPLRMLKEAAGKK
jgi:hypothetical protein